MIALVPPGGYRPVTVGSALPLETAFAAPARVRVLVADDEPALRGALSELLGQEEHVELVGAAADADEAIALARRELPDVALVDVKMPAGGGPRAAREIGRLSPTTRVIALSAFEDRPTVLEMLRAGAVGYLVKGTAAEEIVGSIRRVAGGGTSLSAEVIGGIVHELSSQLRREEIEEQNRQARRDEIERFVAGEGMAMAFQPIVDLATREPVGFEALARFRSIPLRAPDEWFAEAVALELGARLELATIGRSLRGPGDAPARRLPLRELLAPRRRLRRPRRRCWRPSRRGWSSRSPSTSPWTTTTRSTGRSPGSARSACASRSTTRAPGTRASGTRCTSRPTS